MSAIRSPLHARHEAAGAKFGEFGGWLMPLEYADGGVLAEHAAVRDAVGVFDVSHLGTATVAGPGAVDLLDRQFSNSLARIGPGRAQYTLCCVDTGGVLDDLIVYRRADDDLLIVPNAANADAVLRRLRDAAPAGVDVVDRHTETAILAVQGPRASDLMAAAGFDVALDYMSFVDTDVDGIAVTVCRTGYTGERGYELMCDAAAATALWDRLLSGDRFGVRPIGLGARDTLRTEMGYPLHGQDLSTEITPVQAGLGWAVGWDKPDFVGQAALAAEKHAGPRRRLRGLLLTDRGVPRPGMVVLAGEEEVGRVTSGTFSPTLRTGIALALLPPAVELGAPVAVESRGRRLSAQVVAVPFVARSPA